MVAHVMPRRSANSDDTFGYMYESLLDAAAVAVAAAYVVIVLASPAQLRCRRHHSAAVAAAATTARDRPRVETTRSARALHFGGAARRVFPFGHYRRGQRVADVLLQGGRVAAGDPWRRSFPHVHAGAEGGAERRSAAQ